MDRWETAHCVLFFFFFTRTQLISTTILHCKQYRLSALFVAILPYSWRISGANGSLRGSLGRSVVEAVRGIEQAGARLSEDFDGK